jgi:uncharacterized coiled-coil protein SlyX
MAEETTNNLNREIPETEEVAVLESRIAVLEKTLSERDAQLAASRKSAVELQEKLAATSTALTEAVTGYRKLVLDTNPDVTEELLNGDSIQSINESLSKVKSLIGKLRQRMEKDITRNRVPIGSPGRQSSDPSGMSPREKIHYAIGGKR